jgi:integrase
MLMLSAIAEQYLSERSCSTHYVACVRRAAGRCHELSTERINAYLRKRLETVSPNTARFERTIILSLVKYAWERDILALPIKGVMQIKARRPPTRAWTIPQVQAAVAGCSQYGSRKLRTGAPLGLLLRAWILIGYETGSRYGDIWGFTADNVAGDTLRWIQSKTGDPIVKVLSPACREAIEQMLALSPDKRIIGWAVHRRQAMRTMKAHLKSCGLDGTSKWLRRSGATHCEIERPGTGRLHLGHRSVGIFEQAYADWGQIRANSPVTPRVA